MPLAAENSGITATRSPGRTTVTPSPTATTWPNSWPRICGSDAVERVRLRGREHRAVPVLVEVHTADPRTAIAQKDLAGPDLSGLRHLLDAEGRRRCQRSA